jgi:hypothetical protein
LPIGRGVDAVPFRRELSPRMLEKPIPAAISR